MAEAQHKDDFKHFVRIASTDLDGNKPILIALTKIKGIGQMYANFVCHSAGVENGKKTGYLDDASVKKLDAVLQDPFKYNVPSWLLNRRKDYVTGEDKHLMTSDLSFQNENDIKRLKKIRSYKGMRHGVGLPLRGQRTKSNFRRNKGKGSLGVKKKAGSKTGK